jgi:hypothetical protein
MGIPTSFVMQPWFAIRVLSYSGKPTKPSVNFQSLLEMEGESHSTLCANGELVLVPCLEGHCHLAALCGCRKSDIQTLRGGQRWPAKSDSDWTSKSTKHACDSPPLSRLAAGLHSCRNPIARLELEML